MEQEKYTPIKCYRTKNSILLGDLVEDLQGRCGVLSWCEVFNEYYIKTKTGGKIKTRSYIKIKEIYEYKIDTTKVECRRNPNKIKF